MTEKETKIPEKFLDENGDLKADDLLKSYLALEKKMSEPKAPESQMPKSAAEYKIVSKNELIEPDPEINEILFQHGFTNDQAQVVYDLATDKILPIMQEMVNCKRWNKNLVVRNNLIRSLDKFQIGVKRIWMQPLLKPFVNLKTGF